MFKTMRSDRRVALAVRPNKNLVLRGAWGIYHQPIDLMSVPVEDSIFRLLDEQNRLRIIFLAVNIAEATIS